ncbi:MAG: hypothetical protein DLM72_08230 [Candidatus Nitrosopolaris wilkensis]|nr:MAG: hypothetical protein DLM72_08230 [Candidatus Nitrosopolaris wilkensis]
MVFEIIKELRFKLSEVLELYPDDDNPKIKLELFTDDIVNQFFILKPQKLDETIRYLEDI